MRRAPGLGVGDWGARHALGADRLLLVAFLLWLEVRCQALAFGHLTRFQLLGDQIALRYTSAIALGGANVEPFVSLHVVPLHALPGAVHSAQVVLRTGVVLFGGAPEPVGGLCRSLWNAVPIQIQEPEVELRDGVA